MSDEQKAVVKPILQLDRKEVDKAYPWYVCHYTANDIIKNFCGVDTSDVFPLHYTSECAKPNNGFQTLENFLSIQNNPLFDDDSEETLFLFRINEQAHSFVIQKFKEANEEPYYIVYQSWELLYTLSWWLGFKNTKTQSGRNMETIDDERCKKHVELREKYGNKQKLTKDQVKSFLRDTYQNLISHGIGHSNVKTIRCLAFKPNRIPCNTSQTFDSEYSKIEHSDVFLINDITMRENISELKTQLSFEKEALEKEKDNKSPSFFSRSQKSLQLEINLKTEKINALESLYNEKFDLLGKDRLKQTRSFVKILRYRSNFEQGILSQRTSYLFSLICKEESLINPRIYYYPK